MLIFSRDWATATVAATFTTYMWDIVAHFYSHPCSSLIIAFVGVKVVTAAKCRTWPPYGDGINRLKSQFAIVIISAAKLEANWNATPLNEYRTFRTEFSAIGWIGARFFPHQAAT